VERKQKSHIKKKHKTYQKKKKNKKKVALEWLRLFLCVYGPSGKFEPLTHKADLIDIGWAKVLALSHKDAFVQVGGVSVE